MLSLHLKKVCPWCDMTPPTQHSTSHHDMMMTLHPVEMANPLPSKIPLKWLLGFSCCDLFHSDPAWSHLDPSNLARPSSLICQMSSLLSHHNTTFSLPGSAGMPSPAFQWHNLPAFWMAKILHMKENLTPKKHICFQVSALLTIYIPMMGSSGCAHRPWSGSRTH